MLGFDCERLTPPGAEIEFWPQADLGRDFSRLFRELYESLEWRSESITLFGKRMLQPRLLAWYGDPQARYRYSGTVHAPLPWIPLLTELRERIEVLSGASYNSVLANLYRNERDSMGLHADDEPELGKEPVIASLSLGETRVFRLKHRSRKDLKPLRIELPSGSLLVMRGTTQECWKHEVPKSRVPCEARINLTFRTMVV